MESLPFLTTAARSATALCAILSLSANAQTNTIEYWSNHGDPATLNVQATSIVPCINVGFISNAPAITDGSATNYAELTTVLGVACSGSIRTGLVDDVTAQDVPAPTTAAARYAGFYIADVTDIADVGLLNNITLRLYDDGALVKTATGGNLLTLALLGGATSGFIYTDVAVPFDEVELELGSLASVLSSMDVYYAFATAGTGPFGPVATPLSLEALTLSAQPTGSGSVQLAWETEYGEHTSVVVERSVKGGMLPLATMPGATTMYTDTEPLAGQTNFYRLRVRTNDGSVHYSRTVGVFVDASGSTAWAVYPNPATDALHIRVPETGEHRVTLRNAAGGVVSQQTYSADKGGTLTLPRTAMPAAAGLYMLELSTPTGQSLNQRVVLH